MKITISRHELYSHYLEETNEVDVDRALEVLEWRQQKFREPRPITDIDGFLEALEAFYRDHDIDDPEEPIKRGNGEYYPGNSDEGHDWNHLKVSEMTDADRAMIMEAIARFNKGEG